MDLQTCQQQLLLIYQQQPDVRDNISQLMGKAWGSSKKECFEHFTSSVAIVNDYLQQQRIVGNIDTGQISGESVGTALINGGRYGIEQNNTLSGSKKDNTQVLVDHESAPLSQSVGTVGQDLWGEDLMGGMMSVVWILVTLFGIFLLGKLMKYLFIFVYDVLNAHRLLYMKVELPRSDSKSDREQAKELAKDMKEKIGRMSQVYRSLHNLGDLSWSDNFLNFLFYKPKFVCIMSYHEGKLQFVVGTYPEYRNVVEGAVSAQYSEVSIELIPKPHFYNKKYYDILALEPDKDPIYPIRTFKQLEDDPLNNLIDSIGKVSSGDSFHIMMSSKPMGNTYNKRAAKRADGLFRNDVKFVDPDPVWLKIIRFPLDMISFVLGGLTGNVGRGGPESSNEKYQKGGKDFVRMLKPQEDSINAMGEEAASQAFLSSLLLVSASDVSQDQANQNLLHVFASCSVYRDEYNNSFDKNDLKNDVFDFIFKPLWKFATLFCLPKFFFKENVFSANSLASLFHLPDAVYNRSPIIKWMEYKILPPPDVLPVMHEENGYIMGGIVAEDYLGGNLSRILQADYANHWAVTHRKLSEKVLYPIEKFTDQELKDKTIIEKDGKKFVEEMKEKTVYGYKLFKEGVLLGVNIYRNSYQPIYMKRDDRTRHHYIIGKSGTGKSVYIQTLARQDIWNGDGLCLIDPHGDLAEDLLAYIPKERAKDLVYFDAGNEDRPMGLNLYEISTLDEADRVVNDATEIFLKMFGPEIFGPRIQEYFKYGSLTLMEDFEDRPTLLDVVRLFTDEGYREYKLRKVTNPVVRNRREKTFNAMGDREKQEIIPYFSAKFVSFNTNRLIRNVIGQTESAFRFEDIMDNKKILIINLSKGKIGELNAQLLGMIIVSKIYTAAMSRAKIPEKDRKDFYLYVDEFQNFVTDTFADILSEARKYRLSLIMAHQYIAQLESNSGNNIGEGNKSKLKDAVFGNVGTMQSFKIGAPDAEFMEKEYAPVLSGQDIVGIANYKAYMKLNVDNSTSRVFSVNSLYTNEYKNKEIVGILKEYSAKKYGRKREFVDAEISARLGMGVDENKLDELGGEESVDTSKSETKHVDETQNDTKQDDV